MCVASASHQPQPQSCNNAQVNKSPHQYEKTGLAITARCTRTLIEFFSAIMRSSTCIIWKNQSTVANCIMHTTKEVAISFASMSELHTSSQLPRQKFAKSGGQAATQNSHRSAQGPTIRRQTAPSATATEHQQQQKTEVYPNSKPMQHFLPSSHLAPSRGRCKSVAIRFQQPAATWNSIH